METNIPDRTAAPRRESRTNWFLVAIIVLLAIVIFVQGGILIKMNSERGSLSKGRAWRERLQQAVRDRQASTRAPDNQVIFWEPTDDLEQIHDQISRLLRSMTPTLDSSMAGGPFPGIAIQRAASSDKRSLAPIDRGDGESGNRPPAMSPSSRDLNQLQREIERIFADACDEIEQNSLLARVNRGWDMVPTAAAMNIEDRGSNYVVTVALPGYDKQGITISLEGRMLIIGATQPPGAQAGAVRNAAGTRPGRFHTQIMMPDDIGHTGAQAAYAHNVLSVFIPKTQETNSLVRSIAIR